MSNRNVPLDTGVGGLTRYLTQERAHGSPSHIPIDGRATPGPRWSEIGGLTLHMHERQRQGHPVIT